MASFTDSGTLPASNDKEILIRQEMMMLTNFDVDMNLHIGVNMILDLAHELYGENRANALLKPSDQFRNDTT